MEQTTQLINDLESASKLFPGFVSQLCLFYNCLKLMIVKSRDFLAARLHINDEIAARLLIMLLLCWRKKYFKA